MAMPVNSKVKAMPLCGLNSAVLGGGWVIITAATGLPEACFMLRIVNNSNINILVSYDSVIVHDAVRTLEKADLNFQSNSQSSGHFALMAKGTKVYIAAEGQGGGAGFIYLAGYYQI